MGLLSKLFGSNALDEAKRKSPVYFDDVTENILGGFSDSCRGRLITRQTGKYDTVRYYVGDDGTPEMVYAHWRGAGGRVEDTDVNVVYVNGQWRRVDLATGELGQEYRPK